jgi:purine-nucleoside phosphorylase
VTGSTGNSANLLAQLLPEELGRWDAAVVLGSGLSDGAAAISAAKDIPYSEIPGLGETTVKGHKGVLSVGRLGGSDGPVVAVFQGRSHYYETGSMADAALAPRISAAMGARLLVPLSAVGATVSKLKTGTFVAITDHLNLMGKNPLEGVATPDGPPFVDLSHTYRTDIYDEVARRSPGLALGRGVLAAFSGPTYETPAEVNMAKILGAQLVGMSTVPEAVWAKHLGLDVAAYGYVTNPAAGVTDAPLNHEEVVACGASGAKMAAQLIETTLRVWIDKQTAQR